MAPTKELQQALYDEIVGRIKQADSTAPVFDNGYYYYSRFETGQQYPILVRKKGSMEASEEVLLDENAMAAGHGYFSLAGWEVSPDNRLIAYGVDTGGRRSTRSRSRRSRPAGCSTTRSPDVTSNLAWANDSRTLFYTKQDPEHAPRLSGPPPSPGHPAADDPVVFEETDETFSCGVRRTKSDRYLMIASRQTLSTEYRFLDADKPEGTFAVFQARRPRLEYSADHLGDHFYIRTNLDARNFRLMKASGRFPRRRELAGGHPPSRRRAARGLLALPRLPRARGAARRPDPPSHPPLVGRAASTRSISASRPTGPRSARTRSSTRTSSASSTRR